MAYLRKLIKHSSREGTFAIAYPRSTLMDEKKGGNAARLTWSSAYQERVS
jgi:hypothetical protein